MARTVTKRKTPAVTAKEMMGTMAAQFSWMTRWNMAFGVNAENLKSEN
jgi:hypothetical protein